jgi:hypothetical protein
MSPAHLRVLLALLVPLLLLGTVAHAGVPVMKAKMLVYAAVDDTNFVTIPKYGIVTYLYNETTVIVKEKASSTIIISYDPSTNTLKVFGENIFDTEFYDPDEFQKYGLT